MLPLTNITVLDLGQYITGPFATVMLAELGADVIKVESPKGDPFRSWEGGPLKATFMSFNRGKRSVVVDLKTPEGRDSLLRLVDEADVLVENFRPGVMERLTVGPEVLRARNPKLIYCSITGFGGSGPYVDMPAFDGVALAYSGLAGLLIDPEDPKLRGPALADTITGYAAALNILAQLISRGTTGEGVFLEVSMLASLVHFMQPTIFRNVVDGIEEEPYTRPHNSQAFVFVGSDGKPLVIHLSAPVKFWEGLCRATGREDLITDPRFEKRAGRRTNHNELRAELQSVFETRPRDYWVATLQEHTVPCAPVNRVSEILDDPGLRHLGTVDLVEDERFGTVPRMRPPVHVDGSALEAISHAPLLGEHTEQVLGQFSPPDRR